MRTIRLNISKFRQMLMFHYDPLFKVIRRISQISCVENAKTETKDEVEGHHEVEGADE